MPDRTCTIPNCEGPARTRGWCQKHYKRYLAHGDPEGGGRHYATPQESFAARTLRYGQCLLWHDGYLYPNGYGAISIGQGREQLVHRWTYEQHHGPIPEGMEIDHRCHRRNCVEISHLRLTTPKQNRENQQGAYKNNLSSGVRGVSWDKARMKWKAYLGHNGKLRNLGRYDTLAEAETVAQEARRRLFTHNDADHEPATSAGS